MCVSQTSGIRTLIAWGAFLEIPMKIQCRLDSFFISNDMQSSIENAEIVPNISSDHSAITLLMSSGDTKTTSGPGFWKFNTFLLTEETDYI